MKCSNKDCNKQCRTGKPGECWNKRKLCGPCDRLLNPHIYTKYPEKIKKKEQLSLMKRRLGQVRRKYVVCGDCGEYLHQLYHYNMGHKRIDAFYCMDCKTIQICQPEIKAKYIKVKGITKV